MTTTLKKDFLALAGTGAVIGVAYAADKYGAK